MRWTSTDEVMNKIADAKSKNIEYKDTLFEDDTWKLVVEYKADNKDNLMKGLHFTISKNNIQLDTKISVRLGKNRSWQAWGEELSPNIKIGDSLDNVGIRVAYKENNTEDYIDIPKIIEQQIISIMRLNYRL